MQCQIFYKRIIFTQKNCKMKTKKNEVKKENPFNNWLNSIPQGDFKSIKREVMNRCLITRQTFYNWEKGTNIPEIKKNIINQIAGRKIYDL